MHSYFIFANGTPLGIYKADSEQGAYDLLMEDACVSLEPIPPSVEVIELTLDNLGHNKAGHARASFLVKIAAMQGWLDEMPQEIYKMSNANYGWQGRLTC